MIYYIRLRFWLTTINIDHYYHSSIICYSMSNLKNHGNQDSSQTDYNAHQDTINNGNSVSWAIYFLAWFIRQRNHNNLASEKITKLLGKVDPEIVDIVVKVSQWEDEIRIPDEDFEELDANTQEFHLDFIVERILMLHRPTDIYDSLSPISVYTRPADILPDNESLYESNQDNNNAVLNSPQNVRFVSWAISFLEYLIRLKCTNCISNELNILLERISPEIQQIVCTVVRNKLGQICFDDSHFESLSQQIMQSKLQFIVDHISTFLVPTDIYDSRSVITVYCRMSDPSPEGFDAAETSQLDLDWNSDDEEEIQVTNPVNGIMTTYKNHNERRMVTQLLVQRARAVMEQ